MMPTESSTILESLEKHGLDKVRKALVSVTVEKAILDVGNDGYYKVMEELNNRYHCYLPDCYEHPEYLSESLKKLYGKAHSIIIKSIIKDLEEFSYCEPIARFLKGINH